ncbi:phosphoglycerate mutase family protein [Neobacillus drentensis]|uniref:phosphoglycerate mutase family protein n=1 Tax=Neobacillus drentensis TaxID=220684 RepID=UPI002FFE1020
MQILLIRHGESEDDFLEENYNGTTDLPLTPNGRIQVENLGCAVKLFFHLSKKNNKENTRIAVVTHGGMITKLIESFLELPTEHNKWFHTNNTGIHFLDYYKDLQIIKFANSTSHLD